MLPSAEAKTLDGLLFDLDDTVLSRGVLTREAYNALWSAHEAGLRLIAVTGRPSGWGEVLFRMWPIDGFVTENGAVSFVRAEDGSVNRIDSCTPEERSARRAALLGIVEAMKERVPTLPPTDDFYARRADVAWDVAERARVPKEQVTQAIEFLKSRGTRVFLSSVHLHATFDGADKASGVVSLLSSQWGVDSGSARFRYAFVGDSGNDASCFSGFATTFGVANVRDHLARLPIPPRFIAAEPFGAGFAEIVRTVLAARGRAGG